MRRDSIKQFIVLRESLHREKKVLDERLAQINEALEGIPAPQAMPLRAGKAGESPVARIPVRRARNAMSLKKAVIKVTSGHPLTRSEVLEAVKKIGYRFAAKEPLNSLNTVLYSRNQFKNENGKFSPA